jgi:hypothetical protein
MVDVTMADAKAAVDHVRASAVIGNRAPTKAKPQRGPKVPCAPMLSLCLMISATASRALVRWMPTAHRLVVSALAAAAEAVVAGDAVAVVEAKVGVVKARSRTGHRAAAMPPGRSNRETLRAHLVRSQHRCRKLTVRTAMSLIIMTSATTRQANITT